MPTLHDATAKANELRKQLAKLDRIIGKDSERSRDVTRKREQRAASKTVIVPACEDRARRERLEACDEEWLRYYCGDLFWYEFTPQQLAMIEAIRTAILFGGDQALAASRGEGKTKLLERLLLKYTLQGVIKFSVLFAATATGAQDSLQSLRDEVEQSNKLLADYPEVCVPVIALEGTPNRAHYQLVTGHRHDNGESYEGVSSRFTWCGHEIVFPNVPGSPAAAGVIATRGLDSAVRGLSKKNRRPQVVGIDDPDTEETVSNPEQAKKLEKRIDRGIAGLGGQQRGVARIMLTTLQRRECVSAWFTDPSTKPSWKGRRFRFLIKPPDNLDKWQEYIAKRQAALQKTDEQGEFIDPHAREAHAFYLANLAVMDAGAIVANEHRFDGQTLPDGSQLEVSALQRYYNEVARIGQEAVSTEYDNDPAEETGPTTSGITSALVRSRVSGLEQRVLPINTVALTAAIDLGKYYCAWVVIACQESAVGYVVDYGLQNVVGTDRSATPEAIERAQYNALLQWRETMLAMSYEDEAGHARALDAVFVDSGDNPDPVYQFIQVAGPPFYAVKGKRPFVGGKPSAERKVGTGWFAQRQMPSRVWLYTLDSDYWKKWTHERFLTPTFDDNAQRRQGSIALFVAGAAQQQKERNEFSNQICAEVWTEEPFKEGKGIVRKFREISAKNHYLDATYMACAAAGYAGVRLLPETRVRQAPGQRPTLSALAAQAKRA